MEKIFRKSIFNVSGKQGDVINFAKLANAILNDKLKYQCQISKIHAKFQEHCCYQKNLRRGLSKTSPSDISKFFKFTARIGLNGHKCSSLSFYFNQSNFKREFLQLNKQQVLQHSKTT